MSGLKRCPDLDDFAPVDVAKALRTDPGFVFFDTSSDTPERGAVSLVAIEPDRVLRGDFFRESAGLSETWRAGEARVGARVDDGIPRGMIAGGVGYDGRFEMGVYPSLLAYRHDDGSWWSFGSVQRWVDRVLSDDFRVGYDASRMVDFQPLMSRQCFMGMVQRAQEYICAGDIYQVNLSHPFQAEGVCADPWSVYERLRSISPSGYSAFLRQREACVLSSSPELFLRVSGRSIETRPIKGTRPRFGDADEDARSAYELVSSEKERSELVMITDLERNDLGKVCDWGTVTVPEMLRLERYQQVFHLVSTVRGTLREGVGPVEAFAACFPGGSITGAPKKRACEIVAELEPHSRGLYTGALGWWGFGGESQFNIAIRTIIAGSSGVWRFHVGAGIVADSMPAREWDETLEKAAGILTAAGMFSGRPIPSGETI
jgi:anthranilate/para-aminobenzoate synthase component I